jgi:hypothetical protein
MQVCFDRYVRGGFGVFDRGLGAGSTAAGAVARSGADSMRGF